MNETKLHSALIAVFVVLAFLPGLGGDFVNWDDQTHVTENKAVASFDVKTMFTQTVQKIYVPLTTLSFAVEHKLAGAGPFVYHFDNLLLHLANTLLVYFLVQRLGAGVIAAFWAALLFGVHPMRVESVAWVTERKDLLYAFFYLLALLQYWNYLTHTGKRPRSYWATIAFGILSLLAKPMALSLPLVLFLFDWFKGRKFDRCALLEKIPFFLYVVPITWITYTHHVRNPVEGIVEAVLTWTYTFNFYIWKFIWPQTLVPVYHIPDNAALNNLLYVLSFLFFVVFITMTVRLHKQRWWLFAVGYYVLSIFFLLRFDAGKDINIVADRFMYLPSFGFCILFGLGAQKIISASATRKDFLKIAGPMVLWVAIVLLSLKSVGQTQVWNNSITLWTYVIKHNSTEFLAYNDRAVAHIERGFYDLGIADYSAILKFDPDNEDAFYNRGLAYEKVKRYPDAIDDYTKVIAKFPYYEKAYLHRGMAHEAMGHIQAALEDYNRTIAVSPIFPDGYMNRGNILNRQGKFNAALADYNRAIELSPRMERAFNNRGIVFARLSDDKRALADMDAAIAINPRYGEVYYNRSVIYLGMNKIEEALADALKARELGVELPAGYIEGLHRASPGNSGFRPKTP